MPVTSIRLNEAGLAEFYQSFINKMAKQSPFEDLFILWKVPFSCFLTMQIQFKNETLS